MKNTKKAFIALSLMMCIQQFSFAAAGRPGYGVGGAGRPGVPAAGRPGYGVGGVGRVATPLVGPNPLLNAATPLVGPNPLLNAATPLVGPNPIGPVGGPNPAMRAQFKQMMAAKMAAGAPGLGAVGTPIADDATPLVGA